MSLQRAARRWKWRARHTAARARALLRRQGLAGLLSAALRRLRPPASLQPAGQARAEPPSPDEAGLSAHPTFTLVLLPGAEADTQVSIERQRYRAFERIEAAGAETLGAVLPRLAAPDGWLALVQPGALLDERLLLETAYALQQQPGAELIYPDHIGPDGQPARKPDWSPDFLLGGDYIGGLRFFSGALLARLAAADLRLDAPALNFELSLRAAQAGAQVLHIPRALVRHAILPELDPRPAVGAALRRAGLAARLEPLAGQPGLCLARLSPPSGALVSVIICSHDQPALLSACLESLFGLTRGISFEVVLVDHASRLPATRRLIADWQRREPERLVVERAEGPFNFSTLNNAGARRARGQYLVLLNNDVEVISPDWLAEMAGWAQRRQVGAVGACLLYPDDTIQHAGIVLGMRDYAVHAFMGRPAADPGYMGRLRVPSNFLALTGACLMLRRELYERLGGLDERLAVAGGDIDLCLRAYQLGLKNVLLPHARLYHFESATRGFEDTPEKQARLRQEYDLLRQRYPGFIERDPFYHPDFNRARGDFSP